MTPTFRTAGRPAFLIHVLPAFRKPGLPLLLLCTSALAGCAGHTPPPDIAYDNAMPAVQAVDPPAPVTVVSLPKPLPLPGQLKPVGKDGKPAPEAADPTVRVNQANAAARMQPVRDGFINSMQVYPFVDGALYGHGALRISDMTRARRQAPMILPDDLYDYADERPPRRRASHGTGKDGSGIDCIAVIDDWPDRIPVTEAEIDVFERYFGDVLDELFGPSRS